MSSRMRRPETAMLHITQGDWLLVKKHLTAGEERAIFKRMLTAQEGRAIEPLNVGLSKMIGYLLDWSITDSDDKPVDIRDQPAEVVAAALDNLDTDSYREILEAVESHEKAMGALRDAEKKQKAGEKESSPISSSPESLGGATNGLEISTPMSVVSR